MERPRQHPVLPQLVLISHDRPSRDPVLAMDPGVPTRIQLLT